MPVSNAAASAQPVAPKEAAQPEALPTTAEESSIEQQIKQAQEQQAMIKA